MFDSIGADVGCATNAGLLDERGFPKNYNKMIYCDSIASCAGAIFGTSIVTTFIESGAGIAIGGRTGLTALTVTSLFFLSAFILPIFAFIPSSAAASILAYVGYLMMKNINQIDFNNIPQDLPAFFTIIAMPFTYSITKGIGWGILSYIIISIICYVIDIVDYNKIENFNKLKPQWPVSIVTAIIGIFFILYFFIPI
jgi:AGZA family xanthine/uracil permease-like MFS transporter